MPTPQILLYPLPSIDLYAGLLVVKDACIVPDCTIVVYEVSACVVVREESRFNILFYLSKHLVLKSKRACPLYIRAQQERAKTFSSNTATVLP